MSTTPTPDSPQPPLTNRGVVRPDDREGGGIDYLKLTVWATVHEVCENLARGVLDRYGRSVDPFVPVEHWTEKPGGARAARIYDGGCVSVIEFRDEVTRGNTFCSVEVKGEGCAHLGNEGVQLLIHDLKTEHRVRASRVDMMAHTHAFKPRTIRDAVHAGDYSSRVVKPDSIVFIESANGDTCYLGMQSKPKGGLKRNGDRILRIYDRRGPTRVELQMCGEYAHGAGEKLAESSINEWPTLTRGLILHYCNFVDRSADERATRCPRLPWWRDFVEDVEKISVRPSQRDIEGTPLGMVDGIIKRSVKRLYAAYRVFGPDWIISRIEAHARWIGIEHFADHIAELEPFIGTGLAGVPDDDDELPI